MQYDSPLRYPGGKSSIANFLAQIIEQNKLSGCTYYEPFAGGAGAALHLLRKGVVSEIYLNDYNPRITTFWRSVLDESDRFAKKILSVPVSVAEWKRQLCVSERGDASKPFELGFSTFYLNRCNHSGGLVGSAPIGGYRQTGEWKINARFYRKALAKRVSMIAQKRKQIHISNEDAIKFLVKELPRGRGRKQAFVYLDPPYHSNGNRLYRDFYEDCDHRQLACYVRRYRILKWVMSYDDVPPIEKMYTTCAISRLPIQYSFQRKRQTQELLITPSYVQLPVRRRR